MEAVTFPFYIKAGPSTRRKSDAQKPPLKKEGFVSKGRYAPTAVSTVLFYDIHEIRVRAAKAVIPVYADRE